MTTRLPKTIERPFYVFLAGGPYAAFGARRKTIEIRNVNTQYDPKHVRKGRPVILRRGYSTKDNLTGTIGTVVTARNWWELPPWVRARACVADPEESPFFRANDPIIAFEVILP